MEKSNRYAVRLRNGLAMAIQATSAANARERAAAMFNAEDISAISQIVRVRSIPKLLRQRRMAPLIFIKKCGCGRRFSRAQWDALTYVGRIDTPADAYGPAESCELRNCSCGSTIALDLPYTAPKAGTP